MPTTKELENVLLVLAQSVKAISDKVDKIGNQTAKTDNMIADAKADKKSVKVLPVSTSAVQYDDLPELVKSIISKEGFIAFANKKSSAQWEKYFTGAIYCRDNEGKDSGNYIKISIACNPAKDMRKF
jgi:hypothetical protein